MPREGILLVNKPAGITSHDVVAKLRRITGVKKIGHAGTLDPFATGLMILLIGKNYTRKSAHFTGQDKSYKARLCLGVATDSYDIDGKITAQSSYTPTQEEVIDAIREQNGERLQTPPMFSAKKIGGKKLYQLARQGVTIARPPVQVRLKTDLLAYTYPSLEIEVSCSKGTYIRSIAHEIGEKLTCHAHLDQLVRTRCGEFLLEQSHTLEELENCWGEALTS